MPRENPTTWYNLRYHSWKWNHFMSLNYLDIINHIGKILGCTESLRKDKKSKKPAESAVENIGFWLFSFLFCPQQPQRHPVRSRKADFCDKSSSENMSVISNGNNYCVVLNISIFLPKEFTRVSVYVKATYLCFSFLLFRTSLNHTNKMLPWLCCNITG